MRTYKKFFFIFVSYFSWIHVFLAFYMFSFLYISYFLFYFSCCEIHHIRYIELRSPYNLLVEYYVSLLFHVQDLVVFP
jgi:hypothetical protein